MSNVLSETYAGPIRITLTLEHAECDREQMLFWPTDTEPRYKAKLDLCISSSTSEELSYEDLAALTTVIGEGLAQWDLAARWEDQ